MADIELMIKLDEEYIKQIDKIRFLIGGIEDRSLQINVINAIRNGTPLPKGHWIFDGDCLICSKCKKAYTFSGSNFCPNCGADMREVEDDKKTEEET